MTKKYKITNYGETRSVYIKGQTWEIPRNGSITVDSEHQEVAEEFEKFQFIDVEVAEQPHVETSKKEPSKQKKKVTTQKKTKR